MFKLKISVVGRFLKDAARLSFLIVAALLFFEGVTIAAPPDTMTIWRVTANVADAGSDDNVKVGINYRQHIV